MVLIPLFSGSGVKNEAAILAFETSVTARLTTRRHIPGDLYLEMYIDKSTVMRRITTLRSTDGIYDGGPIRLLYYHMIL